MTKPYTEDDIWLLASAIENLRGGSQTEEKRVEAAWRIAAKLADLQKRLALELPETAKHFTETEPQV